MGQSDEEGKQAEKLKPSDGEGASRKTQEELEGRGLTAGLEELEEQDEVTKAREDLC